MTERAEAGQINLTFNPFSASEAVLAETEVDAVFRFSKDRTSLRLHTAYKSRARRYLKSIAPVHYLRSERTYYFPVSKLNQFLLLMKKKNISFAVEETLAAQLVKTAALRAAAIDSPRDASAAQLRNCLLCPIIEVKNHKDAAVFQLTSYTTEQLRGFFPKIRSHAAKKKLAEAFVEEQLLCLLYGQMRNQGEVWLSKCVYNYLESRIEDYLSSFSDLENGFDDAVLSVVLPEYAFISVSQREAGLLIRRDVRQKLCELLPERIQKKKLLPTWQTIFKTEYDCADYLPIRLSEVLAFRSELNSKLDEFGRAAVFESRAFKDLHQKLLKRGEQMKRQSFFQNAGDLEVPDLCPAFSERLFAHQRVAAAWLIETSEAFLGDDMGLGKTLSVLTAYHVLRERDVLDFLLVVCPNSLCRNWEAESKLWFAGKGKLVVMPSTKKERARFLDKLQYMGKDWIAGIAVNYETFRT